MKGLADILHKIQIGEKNITDAHSEICSLFNVRHSTLISDKANVSIDSEGREDLGTWIYELGILLDKKIPLKGLTNAQRIEIAVREYCA